MPQLLEFQVLVWVGGPQFKCYSFWGSQPEKVENHWARQTKLVQQPLSMKDWAKTERWTWGIFQWSSAIVTKHLNILTCSAYTMPKGRCILGALTIYMRKEFSFDTWVNCFGRDMSFCRWTMVLCWTIQVILAKAPRVLRTSGLFQEMSQSNWKRIFAFWWHWLFIWERNLVLKHEWTVLGEIWAFASELWCCAEL